ncbi:uncharacterized protein LOC129738967 [Uranotaenia lowii]|uniref:uncharacterized protein LOC129738967 n=1 Tax=Uranotaenia lowii TaxID=190385 RepID=UPI0024795610|nr:uncharacterized protein LOC129738967 [Uranotaenia lowii]
MKLTLLAICVATVILLQNANTSVARLKFPVSAPLIRNVVLPEQKDLQSMAMDEEFGPMDTISCFPPANRRHRYEWAGGFRQKHILEELNSDHRDRLSDDESELVSKEESNDSATVDGWDNLIDKRNDKHREVTADVYAQYPSSCACQTKYELLDLGYTHFPRYIVNAICQNRNINSRKCWRGSRCKEIPYKVRVLTKRSEVEPSPTDEDQDHHATQLPEPLRDFWRFKTVTIAAACQCSI